MSEYLSEKVIATQAVVVDTSRSPHARLSPAPVDAVLLAGDFWEPRRRVNREVSIPEQYLRIEETGRMDNFRRAAGKKDVPFRGLVYNDSDVYKWLEAACWSLAAGSGPDPELRALVGEVIADMAPAQRPDGYLNTYFALERAGERWTNFDLHEMYCAGHLFQAAIAHYRATGERTLLTVATRFADYICETFGPEADGKREATDGHPEIEMALVELYRATGRRRYLDQARFFIDVRGRGLLASSRERREYYQDLQPFREMERMVGHAVRATYLNGGAADVYAETGDPPLLDALQRMWHNMTAKQMYVTGGIGARHDGESFGRDYELPNERAYGETCAAVGAIMWAWRMLSLEPDGRYADVMETALYNAVLPGVSLDGKVYFYVNPLADDGTHRRVPWFGTACCPPNIARLLASLPGYFYSTSQDGVWVHLYAEGTAHISLRDGRTVRLTQHTTYPWDGEASIEVRGEGAFSLHLRIPGWCREGAAVEVNGERIGGEIRPGSYAEVSREWRAGDVVRLSLPMPVRRLVSHPYVTENNSMVALARGPLIYCLEGVDHPSVDLRDVVLPPEARLTAEHRPETLGGVTVLRGRAQQLKPEAAWSDSLYRPAASSVATGQSEPVNLIAVPYCVWANRAPGRMQVWLRER